MQTEPFSYFEHTADVGVNAWGATLAGAFANAARGMVNLMADPSPFRPREERVVTVHGEGAAELAVAWLNELLFLFDAEGFVPVDYDFVSLTEDDLTCSVRGERFDAARHHARTGVKAATYHKATVDSVADGFRVSVILDI